jgi:hypothetical protein
MACVRPESPSNDRRPPPRRDPRRRCRRLLAAYGRGRDGDDAGGAAGRGGASAAASSGRPATASCWSFPPSRRRLEQVAFGWNQTRHCERSEAIQRTSGRCVPLDCFVANAPRNDDSRSVQLAVARLSAMWQSARRGSAHHLRFENGAFDVELVVHGALGGRVVNGAASQEAPDRDTQLCGAGRQTSARR